MSARGPYAKGVAKRREILDAALRVIGEQGYSGATVKQLAEEVGLSQMGLLHYFDSKDALLVEVLRRRDEVDAISYGGGALNPYAGAAGTNRDPSATPQPVAEEVSFAVTKQRLSSQVRRNAQVAGLVHLFARLTADASEAEHAAHVFFADRYQFLREFGTRWMAAHRDAGEIRQDVDPAQVAVMLFALIDGLQNQWMYDDSLDMGAHIEAFMDLLRPPSGITGEAGGADGPGLASP